MRRWALLLLLPLLCGCAAESPAEAGLTLRIENGHVEDASDWQLFLIECGVADAETPAEITVTERYEDGAEFRKHLSYDGSCYTVEDADGTRQYAHLLYSVQTPPAQASVDFGEFYLLTNDPEMTADRYFSPLLSSSMPIIDELAPTEPIYTDFLQFDRADTYGTPPEELQRLTSGALFIDDNARITPGEVTQSSVFQIRSEAEPLLLRYSLTGELLCTVPAGCYWNSGITLCELENGGFLMSYEDDTDRTDNRLICYRADGSVDWSYAFPYREQFHNDTIFVRDGVIYTFSEVESPSKLLLCAFSMDGELLRSRVFGGSDFTSLWHVEQTEDGFLLKGVTQCRDGDFPLSTDGCGVEFSAAVSRNLELSDVKQADVDLMRLMGYHDNQPIYSDDPIFAPDDRLPADASPYAIFDWEDGYVIVRAHLFPQRWKLNPPTRNALSFYAEMITTGYDAEGVPRWQAVSPVLID